MYQLNIHKKKKIKIKKSSSVYSERKRTAAISFSKHKGTSSAFYNYTSLSETVHIPACSSVTAVNMV